MATFKERIEVGSIDQKKFEPLEALVNSGATYTWIPHHILERLGIAPQFKRRLQLANGSIIEREAAQVPVKINQEVLFTVCIFGDEGSEPLIGAVTLEEFGLGVDPVNQKLVPVISLQI